MKTRLALTFFFLFLQNSFVFFEKVHGRRRPMRYGVGFVCFLLVHFAAHREFSWGANSEPRTRKPTATPRLAAVTWLVVWWRHGGWPTTTTANVRQATYGTHRRRGYPSRRAPRGALPRLPFRIRVRSRGTRPQRFPILSLSPLSQPAASAGG